MLRDNERYKRELKERYMKGKLSFQKFMKELMKNKDNEEE